MFGRPGKLMAPVGGLDTLLAGGTPTAPVTAPGAAAEPATPAGAALCGIPGISFSRMYSSISRQPSNMADLGERGLLA